MIRRINQAGIDLIKDFEGFRAKAYVCPAGVLTIGYGHTAKAGKPFVLFNMSVTQQEAEEILKKDLDLFEQATQQILGDANEHINDNQFSALVSFCYNIGPTQFSTSTLLKRIKENNLEEVAKQFERWVFADGQKLSGLVRRRKAEQALFKS